MPGKEQSVNWRKLFSGATKSPAAVSPHQPGWHGDYASWDQARCSCSGYSDEAIFRKTLDAARRVRDGNAVYERDSMVFDRVAYSWPLLAGLMWAAARGGGVLDVLDFGGALGSTYYQNHKFFSGLQRVRWSIVEQPRYVAVGREEFENGQLRFYESIDACRRNETPNVVVLSSVLPFLESPHRVLSQFLVRPFEYVIIDRTAFWHGDRDRLGIQVAPPEIFEASYPMWVFSLSQFREHIRGVEIVEEFESFEDGLFGFMFRGYILKVV